MCRFIILATIFIAIASATKVNECKGKPAPFEVRIKGCDTPPCDVVKGSSAEMEIDFSPDRQIKGLTPKVMATVMGLTVPYQLPEDLRDACEHLLNDAFCPLDANEDITYKFIFPVAKIYPEIGVNIELTLNDDNDKPVTCFNVDIQVKA